MVEFVKNFGEIAPHALGLVGQVNEGQMRPVVKKIRDFYLSAMTKEEDLKKRLSLAGAKNLWAVRSISPPYVESFGVRHKILQKLESTALFDLFTIF